MSRFEIVHTDAEQPFHVRIVASNGEPVLSSENLEHAAAAERVVLLVAEAFGLEQVEIRQVAGDWCVVGDTGPGAADYAAVEVRYVDERAS